MPLLYGRESETRLIADFVRQVRGGGAAMVVRGEAGIGKSALLSESAGVAAAHGLRILKATGVESETHMPFAGLHQLLLPINAEIAELPAPQRDALGAAFGLTDTAVPDLFLIALAVLNLLGETAARSPVLLIVEDAHWLDRSSADVLAFVARRLDAEPVVMLAAIRDGFSSSFDEAGLRELQLERLDDDDAAALLDARNPGLAPAVRRRLLKESAGNPLALVELPLASQGQRDEGTLLAWLPLTTRLERAFTARVSGLPSVTRTLLLVAALNDGVALTETLEATSVIVGERVTVAALTPALAMGLVDVDEAGMYFRHPLMRSAIRQSASMSQRHTAHAALAGVLADQADRGIWHRAASSPGPDESIASELEIAAARAHRQGAIMTAAAALERAARLSDDPTHRVRRLLRAAEYAVELGRHDVVVRLLRETEPLELSPHQQARIVWIRESFDDGIRDDSAGVPLLTEVAERAAADGDIGLALKLLGIAALRCFWVQPGPEARQRVITVAESLPVDKHDSQLLMIFAYAAPVDRGAVVLDRLPHSIAAPGRDSQAVRLRGSAAVLVGDFDLAEALSAASIIELRAQGRLGLLARALGAQAWSAVHLADLSVAIPAVEEAGRLARETAQPLMYAIAQATGAMLAALRGEYDRVETFAAEAERASMPVGARPVLATVQLARGLAELGRGRYDAAYDHLRRMHDPADPAYHIGLRCYALTELADAAMHSGRGGEIAGIVEEMEAIALRTPSPSLHAGLRHARAVLADDAEAEPLFQAALQVDMRRWPFVRARAQLAYGEWLRRRRRSADSQALLRAARETFDALGVIPWSERARQELRASGETSRRRDSEAQDRLTPQELQIVQMAAEGLTNKEIGQKLYLSHRTVSSHLYRIFPKLGIASRSELGTTLRASA
ncbi:helix-turn-helix transcriptional regulator [Streptosporangium subroseum]|uniref:helix-turn-helix transcriptional regulator n=1 Tax=Streptosporangium subroseum TaxID=106412 RepID=UPI003086784B|nr:AAA family ATPase [Streptosporangium subroseum]